MQVWHHRKSRKFALSVEGLLIGYFGIKGKGGNLINQRIEMENEWAGHKVLRLINAWDQRNQIGRHIALKYFFEKRAERAHRLTPESVDNFPALMTWFLEN